MQVWLYALGASDSSGRPTESPKGNKIQPSMRFDPEIHNRHSVRLPEYDYTRPGAYFVTLVTFEREWLFGAVVGTEMQLSDYGRVAAECWTAIPEHFPRVELGKYVIMPNHVHGIIVLHERERGAATTLSADDRAATWSPPVGAQPRYRGICDMLRPYVNNDRMSYPDHWVQLSVRINHP